MNPRISKAALAAGCSVLLFGASAYAEPEVGNVAQRQFLGATGTRESGERRDLYFNEPVYSNEVVQTGARVTTNLKFLDRTNLFVGENSQVVLDKFVYDPEQRLGDVAISFTKGAFRFVTGEIQNKEAVSLKTPTATMTIRGTELVIFVLPDGTSEVNVLHGAVDLTPCESDEATRLEQGRALIITSSCETTSVEARSLPFGQRYPKMPPEYAALEDGIEPAGGPAGPKNDRDNNNGGRERERPQRSPSPSPSPSPGGDNNGGDIGGEPGNGY